MALAVAMSLLAAIGIALFAFASIVIVNSLHFCIKAAVRQRGYPVSFWWGHYRDIRFMREMIASEKDPTKKLRYQKILYGYFISMVVFILTGLAIMLSLS
jgi:hypothetical protein